MGVALSLSLSTTAFANTAPQGTPQAIEKLDVERYMGKWYEIGRLPASFQKKCVGDVTAQYSLNADQSVKVVNTCRTKEGALESSEALAKAVNEGKSKLKVSFLPKGLRWLPFAKGDYWVLRIDDSYNTVLVGGKSTKYLWILSRSPQIDDATYQSYLNTAKQQGYDISKVMRTKNN